MPFLPQSVCIDAASDSMHTQLVDECDMVLWPAFLMLMCY